MGIRSEKKRNRRREAFRRRTSRVQDQPFIVDQHLSWLLVVMRPGTDTERRVRRDLIRLGATPFVPGYTEEVRGRRDKLVPKRRLYFSRYVIVGVTGHADRRAIEELPDVSHIVKIGEHHAAVPARELQVVAERLTGNVEQRADIARAGLMLGELMRVKEGPFASFQATIEEILVNGRVRTTVNVFGRATPVEFEPQHLEAA